MNLSIPHLLYINTSNDSSLKDYYPFGMVTPGRNFFADNYRFGFNGMEKYEELKGSGNSLDFGARNYDSRVARWFNCDPLEKKYAGISTYVFANSNPIIYKDVDGKDWIYFDESEKEIGRTKSKFYHFHWLTGDVIIKKTKAQVEKGGFIGYGVENGDFGHSFAIIKKTGDIYEILQPTDPKTGKILKGNAVDELSTKSSEKSQVYKYTGGKTPDIIDNKSFWSLKQYDPDDPDKIVGTRSAASIAWIWVDDLSAVTNELDAIVGKNYNYNLFNLGGGNCKQFALHAISLGFKEYNAKDAYIREAVLYEMNVSRFPTSFEFGFNLGPIENPLPDQTETPPQKR